MEVPTLWISINGPVRVLPVVSSKMKVETVDVPVSAPAVQVQSTVDGLAAALHVNVVVSAAGSVSESVPVGLVRLFHR